MSRLNMILLIALLVSSIYLVRVSYDSRRLFADLDRAQEQERVLEHDKERLQTELRTQATPLRVEKTARERLGMRTASPAVTQYVTVARAASGTDASTSDGAIAASSSSWPTASSSAIAAARSAVRP